MSLWLGTLSASGISIPAIGESVYGGYMAGIIDTVSSGGSRYLLITSPKSLESAGNFYDLTSSMPSVSTNSRWDGLENTVAQVGQSSTFSAAKYCYDLSYPTDGGSRWYLPARDELELMYRNLKCTTDSNVTTSGVNPSSDPIGSNYTASSPAQTSVTVFQGVSAAERLYTDSNSFYWSSTISDSSSVRGGRFTNGESVIITTASFNSFARRPVRRILL